MSVFRTDWLPPVQQARGKRFFILHSPQDAVCPFVMAEQARHTLKREGGATTELSTYTGGHGWRGDIWAQVREGIVTLDGGYEEQAVPPDAGP